MLKSLFIGILKKLYDNREYYKNADYAAPASF